MAVITRVDVDPLQLPLATPIASALGTYTHVDCVVVRIRVADGPTGWGFTASLGGSASAGIAPFIGAELAPLVVGADVRAPELLWSRMWAPNKPRLRAGIGAWALSAVDIAVWDAFAKELGVPLVTLLGGKRRAVPVYGSGGWHTLTDDELIDEALGFIGQGIGSYKFKTGTARDRHRTALLRGELGGGVRLYADANQRFGVADALEHARMLAEFDVAWLEEPVLADTIDDLAAVAARSPVPIAAGENAYFRWEFREIAERRAAAFLQPDIGRVGGVTEFRRVGVLADAFELKLCSHLWHELSISLVGAAPSGFECEYAELIPSGALTREFAVVDGHIEIPDVAGHGVEFTEEAIVAFRPT